MEKQHFYFVKSFVDEYKELFNISIIFQSHLFKRTFFDKLKLFIKKNSAKELLKKIICSNNYSKEFKSEQKLFYDNVYPDININYFYDVLGEEAVTITSDINSSDSVFLVNKLKPDLFLLQGGKLLKDDFLKVLQDTYILHLHLGIVPYYRGGNSQFWSIYNNKINENGFTIQSVDLGIDTGDIYIRKSVIDFKKEDTQHSMFYKTQVEGINAIKSLINFYIDNKTLPKAVKVREIGMNYSGKMMTSCANEYVSKNRERIFNDYKNIDAYFKIYEDISVI